MLSTRFVHGSPIAINSSIILIIRPMGAGFRFDSVSLWQLLHYNMYIYILQTHCRKKKKKMNNYSGLRSKSYINLSYFFNYFIVLRLDNTKMTTFTILIIIIIFVLWRIYSEGGGYHGIRTSRIGSIDIEYEQWPY